MLKILMKIWNKIKFWCIFGNSKKSKELAQSLIIKNNIKIHTDVSYFIQSKMKYVSDPLFGIIDIQQDLDYTVKRGWKGDCDDYAVVAYRLLEALAYEPEILTLMRKNITKNHVVCIFKIDEKIGLIGTEGFEEYENLENLLKKKKAIEHTKNQITRR